MKDSRKQNSGNASMRMNGINMRVRSIKGTSRKRNSLAETSEQLTLTGYPSTTYSVEAFHARLSQLLEEGKDLTTREARYFLKLLASSKPRDHALFSLKTSRDYSATTTEEPSQQSSIQFQNWGIGMNGKCLTARILESHKTGKECSLSDILESKADKKYFLSEKMVKSMLETSEIQKRHVRLHQHTIREAKEV